MTRVKHMIIIIIILNYYFATSILNDTLTNYKDSSEKSKKAQTNHEALYNVGLSLLNYKNTLNSKFN